MSLKRRLFTILFGATGGYLVGLTSIGSGSVMAVILLLLYPLAPAIVVGTDIAHATVLSLVTGFAHTLNGNVDFALAGTILLGSVPGVWVGSGLSVKVPTAALRTTLAVVLLGSGLGLLAKAGAGVPAVALGAVPLVAVGLIVWSTVRDRRRGGPTGAPATAAPGVRS